MKIIFAGTPEFAVTALSELAKEHEIVAVLTQPDRPSGRGMQLSASPVKKTALRQGLVVYQPITLKSEEIQHTIANLGADVMVVAAYGLILPKAVLRIPRYGCINIHASLLPRWRGAAPIQRSILEGDKESGITIMQMDEGLDTGDMLLKKACTIAADETSQTLHDKLAVLGAQGIIETMHHLENAELRPIQQNSQEATYAPKLSKAEARIDWAQDAEQIDRAIRGYFPFPVAYTLFGDIVIRILRAKRTDARHKASPGTVLAVESTHLVVASGKGAIALEMLQKPGGKVMPVVQFLQSLPIKAGDRFTST